MQSEARKDEAWLFETPPEPRANSPTTFPFTPLLGIGQTFASLYFLRFGTVYQDNSLILYNTPTAIGPLHALRSWMVGRMGFPCHIACTIGIHEAAKGMAACNHDEMLIPIPFPAAFAVTVCCSPTLCAVLSVISPPMAVGEGGYRSPAIQCRAVPLLSCFPFSGGI
ncbi:hypothetical protein LX36DRAFT_64989 [Colletotrichum falcatum]|nr:hypothetical protein LX36DRAFT_64989 [Colletotrichum falcatum]